MQPTRCPRIEGDEELILKQNTEVVSTGIRPGLFLLGNRSGFLWLSKYFAWIASRINESREFSKADPDDHEHLDRMGPFSSKYSDNLGLIVGSFSQRHRTKVFKACSISKKNKEAHGSIATFRNQLKFMMASLKWLDDAQNRQFKKDLEGLASDLEDCLAELKKKS